MSEADDIGDLRCPITGQRLAALTSAELARMNAEITAGRVYTRLGVRQTERLEGAMRSADAAWHYAVVHGIAQLLTRDALTISTAPIRPRAAGHQSEE